MEQCLTCELAERREMGNTPLWDDIYRSQYWYVVHSFNVALPGWLVVISQRHIAAIDELTEAEAGELGFLIRRVSLALHEAVVCTKTYVAQFAEASGHHHVHFHVIPRMADQPADRIGTNIFKYLGVSEIERVSEVRMNEIGTVVRRILIEMATIPAK